jgi:integrase
VTAYIRSRQHPDTLDDGTTPPGKANGTINRELGILQRVLKLASRRRKLARVPTITLLREDNARQGFFERDQYEAVWAHLHARPDVQVVLGVAYTLRRRIRSEVLPLTWNRVDLEKLTVRLEPGTTKNRDGREVSLRMFPHLVQAFREQRARVDAFQRASGRIVPYVFPHLDPESPHAGNQLSDFRRTWATACRRAGLTGKIRHDFRRTAVRNMERAGVPRSVAMKITGHKTELIYRRYAIVDAKAIDEGLAKLAALHQSDGQASPKVVSLASAR